MQTLSILQKIIPKEIETLHRRYNILNMVQSSQPVGRRLIASKLNIGEKIVRSDTEFLRTEGYVVVSTEGMKLTEAGLELIESLNEVMREFEGIKQMEIDLKEVLGCKQVLVVSGNTDIEPEAMSNIGRTAAKLLNTLIEDDSIIAITGGHTMKSVVSHIQKTAKPIPDAMIVPARGSLGNNVETQANTLVETMAKKLNCQYKLLNLPDNLSVEAIETVSQDPQIKKVIKSIRKANIIVFGIGNAKKMAYRRDLNKKVLNILTERKAVAEALGYYFNRKGEMVYDSKTIGFHLDEFESNIHPIAVAGGESKALAILSVRKFIKNGSLIIDKACGAKVLQLAKEFQYNK